ncbi:hypothetical protein ACIRS1_07655 [Kitasatospora sp. NPDC101176]|uniref:hypothetical protein n=1 Tax=Kitasatospora sp. NPDC101176 TaxID=3364099 RepID=UPI0038307362
MTGGPGARLGRLCAATALTAALALGGVAVDTAPAAAAPLPMDQCTTTSGVVLAVDFSRWGGPLLRSCGSTPTTGYALLNQGGWKTAGTGHDGPAFICRIGYSGYQGGKQFPTPDQEKCVLTPPATAYWSYWHADPGQNEWSYSQLGAMSYHPKPGSVDLWIFGGTDIEGTEGRPSFSPDTVRAHSADPGGQPADPGQGSAGASGGAAGGSSGGSGAAGGSGSGSGASGGPGGGSTGAGGATGGGGAAAASGSTGATGGTGGTGGTGRVPAPARPPAGGARPPAPATPPTGGTAGTPQDGITPPGAPEPVPVPATPVPVEPSTPAPTDPPTDQSAPPAVEPAVAAPTATPAVPGGVVNADPVADAPHDSGSMLPAVVGSVLVVALGGATVVTARRRRRRAE